MRKTLAALSGVAVAMALSFGMSSTSEAAPGSGLPALQVDQSSLVQNVHSRRYHHCHRRCYRHRGHVHCRRVCHRGGYRW
jgi:hypothetical protein